MGHGIINRLWSVRLTELRKQHKTKSFNSRSSSSSFVRAGVKRGSRKRKAQLEKWNTYIGPFVAIFVLFKKLYSKISKMESRTPFCMSFVVGHQGIRPFATVVRLAPVRNI